MKQHTISMCDMICWIHNNASVYRITIINSVTTTNPQLLKFSSPCSSNRMYCIQLIMAIDKKFTCISRCDSSIATIVLIVHSLSCVFIENERKKIILSIFTLKRSVNKDSDKKQPVKFSKCVEYATTKKHNYFFIFKRIDFDFALYFGRNNFT